MVIKISEYDFFQFTQYWLEDYTQGDIYEMRIQLYCQMMGWA